MNTIKKHLGRATLIIAALALTGYLGAKWYMGVLFPKLDHEPPVIGAELQRPAILVFHKANGYVHKDALPKANAVLRELAERNNWGFFATENGAVMNTEQLALFDVVVWNNTSGTTLTATQQQDFRQWLENGGGFVGLHAAGGDPWYEWPWYVNTLLGAQFIGHTMSPQFQDADVLRVAENEITAHLSPRWSIAKEEWYAFDRNPRELGYEIQLAMDENSYDPNSATMDGEHPIAWRHTLNNGRVFYSAIGHQAATYDIPEYQALIEKAIRWAGKLP